MRSVVEIKNAMADLGTKAKTILADNRMTPAVQMKKLDALQADLDVCTSELETHKKSRQLMSGGSMLGSDEGMGTGYGRGGFGAKTFGGPSFMASPEQIEALHRAATSKQTLRVETKAAVDLGPAIPVALQSGIIAFRREPTRVASLFPSGTMAGPSLEYLRHASTTGTATTVAAGGLKPEITPVFDQVIATARKIAAHIAVTDESLFDFSSTSTYVNSELVNAITAAENTQLLSGNGTAPNLGGILLTSGVLTRTQAIAPETVIDTLELAMNDLRIGATLCEPDGFVMHPSDWSAIRLLKNTQGEYLLGHPTSGDPATLWGKPVVLTTNIPAKTVLVGAFAVGGEVLYRQGVTLETGSNGLDWTSNLTRFRAEERLALAIYRPSAFAKVTLL